MSARRLSARSSAVERHSYKVRVGGSNPPGRKSKMKTCQVCKKEKTFLNQTLKICLDCIRERAEKIFPFVEKAHQTVREKYNLPPFPPRTKGGIKCNLCQNQCQIGPGEKGYCGLRENKNNKLESKADANFGLLDYYFDPIPTNCCASWFCEASNFAPKKKNLAVFFYGCGFDCLFCQNYNHKLINLAPKVSAKELFEKALDPTVYCVCFFGGSPESQLPFVINFSQKILKKKKVRICLEWNGIGNENLVRKIADLVLKSRGIIKFDLKAFDENLSFALSGVSNKKAYENFEMIAKEFLPKANYPLLTATTLLVPGYVDKFEVEKIAKFVASLDRKIPYSLLVFFPAFYMEDLPITPKDWALECLEVAKKYLENVNLGNKHLLFL